MVQRVREGVVQRVREGVVQRVVRSVGRGRRRTSIHRSREEIEVFFFFFFFSLAMGPMMPMMPRNTRRMCVARARDDDDGFDDVVVAVLEGRSVLLLV